MQVEQTELQQVLASISDLKTEFKDLKIEFKDLKSDVETFNSDISSVLSQPTPMLRIRSGHQNPRLPISTAVAST